MSGGTKVALVALMVLIMVIIAKLVDDESADGLGEGPGTGVPDSDSSRKGVDGTSAREAELAAKKPEARTRPGQTRPGGEVQTSTNPPPRPSVTPRANDARRSVARGSGSSRPVSDGSSARPSTRNPRVGLRTTPGAAVSPGPISGDPAIDPGSGARADAGGVTTTPEAPVSVGGRAAAAITRGARQLNPVVSTQLSGGAEPARSLAMGAEGAERSVSSRSPAPRARPDPGTSPRGSGTTQVKDYDVERNSGTARKSVPTPAPKSPLETDFPVTYTIQPNDSPWKIAEKHYGGRGYLYPHIVKSNPGVKMHPGKSLIIPAPPPPSKKSSAPATDDVRRYGNAPSGATATRRSTQSKMYTVRKGETLWEIAGREYGDPTQYLRIKNANPQLKNADDVKAGTKILIP